MDTAGFLAPGEDVATTSAPDAKHWCDFYRQRASFDETVRLLKARVEPLMGNRRQDVSRQALPILIADAERFQGRFDFWEARLAQLT